MDKNVRKITILWFIFWVGHIRKDHKILMLHVIRKCLKVSVFEYLAIIQYVWKYRKHSHMLTFKPLLNIQTFCLLIACPPRNRSVIILFCQSFLNNFSNNSGRRPMQLPLPYFLFEYLVVWQMNMRKLSVCVSDMHVRVQALGHADVDCEQMFIMYPAWLYIGRHKQQMYSSCSTQTVSGSTARSHTKASVILTL